MLDQNEHLSLTPEKVCFLLISGKVLLMTVQDEKPLIWIGSSRKDLQNLPRDVQRFFGFALDFDQRGEKHDDAKVLKGFGGAGVLEVIEDDIGG